MSNKNNKAKIYKGYSTIPHAVGEHDDFRLLSPRATKLLIDMLGQYRGNNNGDLCCAMSIMKLRGWNSNDQLMKAKNELVEKELILLTKQGGRNFGPNLYAITWQPINECGGKLQVKSTNTSPRLWREPNRLPAPPVGADSTATRYRKLESVNSQHRH